MKEIALGEMEMLNGGGCFLSCLGCGTGVVAYAMSIKASAGTLTWAVSHIATLGMGTACASCLHCIVE